MYFNTGGVNYDFWNFQVKQYSASDTLKREMFFVTLQWIMGYVTHLARGIFLRHFFIFTDQPNRHSSGDQIFSQSKLQVILYLLPALHFLFKTLKSQCTQLQHLQKLFCANNVNWHFRGKDLYSLFPEGAFQPKMQVAFTDGFKFSFPWFCFVFTYSLTMFKIWLSENPLILTNLQPHVLHIKSTVLVIWTKVEYLTCW